MEEDQLQDMEFLDENQFGWQLPLFHPSDCIIGVSHSECSQEYLYFLVSGTLSCSQVALFGTLNSSWIANFHALTGQTDLSMLRSFFFEPYFPIKWIYFWF